MPPVIPRLYSNPTSLGGSATDEANAMARLSAAAAAGLPSGWPHFLGGQAAGAGAAHPGNHGAPNGSFGSLPFGANMSFPSLFGSPLGFHPGLDFSSMRLPHSSLPGATGDNNHLDLKGLDPRAVLSAYIGDLANANARHTLAGLGPQHGQEPGQLSSGESVPGSEAALNDQHRDLLSQAEKFNKAAAAMYGQRFFPYSMRPFMGAGQNNSISDNGLKSSGSPNSRSSPAAHEKTSNPASLSPHSSRGGDSMSPTLLNSNNSSNISGKGGERASSSGSGRSPVPELKNIERMVEGLHSNNSEPVFVPTSVAS